MAVAKFVGGPLDGLDFPPSRDPAFVKPLTVTVTPRGAVLPVIMPSGRGAGDQTYDISWTGVAAPSVTYTLTGGNYV